MTINIALTSYPRRITNCVPVINSVLGNTIQPDRIYLTLSHLEFPNYEQDLPQDLYKLIMTSNKVILNWVEDNYKSMKKVFPILPYLEDDDIIIPIDDDMILPKDLIESRYNDFKNTNFSQPITSNLAKTINMDNMVFTVYSLVQKKMLNGYDKFVTDKVLQTYNDDRTMLYLCQFNGYLLKPCSKYCYNRDNPYGIVPLDIAPRSDYQYTTGVVYDKELETWVAELSGGKKICDCFGLFTPQEMLMPAKDLTQDKKEASKQISKLFQYNPKKNIKHDIVYVLGSGSKYDNLEIKISITSMLKFCNHWVRNIYVVGENSKIQNKRVKHIYVPDITKTNKDANIIHKLLTAINKIPTLSENFLFCSDDIMVTKKSDWEDFTPRYIFEYPQDQDGRELLYKESKNNQWDKLLLNTLDNFIGIREHIYFYEPHIFAPINKKLFKNMCKSFDYIKSKNNIIMSLWFNWLNLDQPAKRFDHTSVFNSNPKLPIKYNRHLTYNDKSFANSRFRDELIRIVTMDQFKN